MDEFNKLVEEHAQAVMDKVAEADELRLKAEKKKKLTKKKAPVKKEG